MSTEDETLDWQLNNIQIKHESRNLILIYISHILKQQKECISSNAQKSYMHFSPLIPLPHTSLPYGTKRIVIIMQYYMHTNLDYNANARNYLAIIIFPNNANKQLLHFEKSFELLHEKLLTLNSHAYIPE